MLSDIEQFQKWLRRKAPHSSTHIHYTSDLKLFFVWLSKPANGVTVRDVDAFIEHCQNAGYAIATINRRLAAIRSFYQFLAMMFEDAPANPVRPKRHFIRPRATPAPRCSGSRSGAIICDHPIAAGSRNVPAHTQMWFARR